MKPLNPDVNPFDKPTAHETEPNIFMTEWARARTPTEEHRETTQMCIETAREWEAGRLPLTAARPLCAGYDLFVAINQLQRGAADRVLLIRYAEELVEAFDVKSLHTKHGTFLKTELDDEGAMYDEHRIVFPVGFEWAERPTPGNPGRRGVLIYPDFTKGQS